MSIEGVPTLVVFAARSATAGLLLVRCTVTPPCCDAPRRAVKFNPVCSPAPIDPGRPSIEMPGTLTVVVTVAAFVAMKPGIVADTVVCPDATGRNDTPPAATVDGDAAWPGAIVTVTGCPVAAGVASWA